jgi:pimeloyl-ACP methyl ester carboxylesterase
MNYLHVFRTGLIALPLLAYLAGCADGGPSDAELEQYETSALSASADAAAAIDVELFDINGLTFEVRTAGPKRGELVILLHGFPESSYEWRHQITALAAAGYRVLAPNLRGTSPGARPSDVEAYSLLNLVDDVLKLADAAKARRFHLVGHDWGGMVAWGTAQLFGGRLLSLTAVSVPHPGAFADMLSDPQSCQSKASAWYNEVIAPDAAERALAGESLGQISLLDTWSSFAPDAQAEYEGLLGTPEALDKTFHLWRANMKDGKPTLALPIPVFVPTLYVWGDRDPFNCGEGEPMTKRLVWAPYRFERIEGADHWIPELEPERLNRALLSHLRRHGR